MTEKAVASFKACGAGKGPDACIFLIVGANGPECARFSELHYSLISRKRQMVAQREPTEPFPQCQLSAKEPDVSGTV